VRQRVGDYWLEHIAPGSIFGQRLPIGTEESIKGLVEQDFKDYYTQVVRAVGHDGDRGCGHGDRGRSSSG
jgi:predicted Zn-dependent peptidase